MEMRAFDTGVMSPRVNIRAFDKHEQPDVPLVSAGAVFQMHLGPVIAIVHHGAFGLSMCPEMVLCFRAVEIML